MKNLSDYLTDLWTIQDLSEIVGKISTSWHLANLDLATGHCFTNSVVEGRQMLSLGCKFRHGYTLGQKFIV